MFERTDVGVGNTREQDKFLVAGQRTARIGNLQFRRVGVKPFFRLHLQQALRVRFGQRRQFRLRRQDPFQRHANDAIAFAHARRVQLIADFAAHEFRCGGQRIKRELRGKTLQLLQRAVRAPQHHAVELAAVQRQTEHGSQLLRFSELEF